MNEKTMKILTMVALLTVGVPVSPWTPGAGCEEAVFSSKAAIHLARANGLIGEGKIREAEEEFRRAVKEDPDSEYLKLRLSDCLFQLEAYEEVIRLLGPEREKSKTVKPYIYLALAYQYTDRVDQAVAVLDELYRSENATPEDLIHVGRILILAERYRDALRYFEKARASLPADAELQALMGDAYIALEDREKAREMFEEAARNDPDQIRNWLVLAQLAEDEARWTDALELYGKALVLAQQPFALLQSIMRVSNRLGDFHRAIEMTEALAEAYPENGMIWGMLGILCYQGESLEEANRAILKAIDLGIDSFQLYLTLGRSLLEMDKSEEAIRNLEKAVELKPDEFLGWINLSLSYLTARKYEEAMASLNRAGELQPESEQVLYLRGVILSRQERYMEAIDPLERALAASPESEDIIFSLAVAFERTEQKEKAEELLRKVLLLDPDNPEALNYLGYMWAEKGERLDEAREYIAKALESDPENGYIIDSMAWVYYQKAEYQKALEEILHSIQYVKDDPVIYEHLGDIYRKLGRLDESREAWKKSLELDPKNEKLRNKLDEHFPPE